MKMSSVHPDEQSQTINFKYLFYYLVHAFVVSYARYTLAPIFIRKQFCGNRQSVPEISGKSVLIHIAYCVLSKTQSERSANPLPMPVRYLA